MSVAYSHLAEFIVRQGRLSIEATNARYGSKGEDGRRRRDVRLAFNSRLNSDIERGPSRARTRQLKFVSRCPLPPDTAGGAAARPPRPPAPRPPGATQC